MPSHAAPKTCKCGAVVPASEWPRDQSGHRKKVCRTCSNSHPKRKLPPDERRRRALAGKRAARERRAAAEGRQLLTLAELKEQRRKKKEEQQAAQLARRVLAKELKGGGSHSAHVLAWQKANPAAYFRHRYATDPEFVLLQRMRARMRKHAKRFAFVASYFGSAARKGKSGSRIWSLVGYSPDVLRRHIELQFTRGMNWSKLLDGQIHIDHIVPVSAFKLDDEASVRECWALSNLRPLWADENIAKAARRETLV